MTVDLTNNLKRNAVRQFLVRVVSLCSVFIIYGCGGGGGSDSGAGLPPTSTATQNFVITSSNANDVFFESFVPLESVLFEVFLYLPVYDQLALAAGPGVGFDLGCDNNGSSTFDYISSTLAVQAGDRIIERSSNCTYESDPSLNVPDELYDGTVEIVFDADHSVASNVFSGTVDFQNYRFRVEGFDVTLNGKLKVTQRTDQLEFEFSTVPGEWLVFKYGFEGIALDGAFQIASLSRTANSLSMDTSVYSRGLNATFGVSTSPSLVVRLNEYPESGSINITSDVAELEIQANNTLDVLVPGTPPSANFFLYIDDVLQTVQLPDDGDPLTPNLGTASSTWEAVSFGFLVELP